LVGPQRMRATGSAPIQRKSCAMPRARVGHPQRRAGRQGMGARDGLSGRQFRWQSRTFVIPVLVLRALRPCLRPGRGERQERSLWHRFPDPAPATVRIPSVRGDGGPRPPGPTPSDDRVCKTQRDKRPTRPRRALAFCRSGTCRSTGHRLARAGVLADARYLCQGRWPLPGCARRALAQGVPAFRSGSPCEGHFFSNLPGACTDPAGALGNASVSGTLTARLLIWRVPISPVNA